MITQIWNIVTGSFYGLSWYIAFFSATMLFGTMKVSAFWKTFWAITGLLAAVCILDSLEHPAPGHWEYSMQGQEWVNDD